MSEDNNKKVLDATVFAANVSQSANSELGITQEYNKENRDKLWDSQSRKTEFKEKQFNGKNTYEDSISGKTLHKNQNAAQNKYHMRNEAGEVVSSKWAEHSAETDHINALKDLHEKHKENPFLSDKDFKEIVNSDENYRILSKSLNTSKGDKSDWQMIFDKNSELTFEGRTQMAKEKIKSDVALTTKFAARTGKNIGTEFASGAKDTLSNSVIPLTVEAVSKLIKVAQGEESLGDAAKDMAKTTMSVAVAGGSNRVVIDMVTTKFANSSSVVLKNIAGSNQVGQIVAVALIVQESALQYINGDIDGKEFIQQVGIKGTTMVAGMIGGQVGKEIGAIIGGAIGTALIPIPGAGTGVGMVAGEVIGQILGTIITTVACGTIATAINVMKHMDDYKKIADQFDRISSDAIKEIENQRLHFKKIIEEEYHIRKKEINEGFEQILVNSFEECCNVQGINSGIDQVLSAFGKSVRFESVEEYKLQLDKPLII